MPELKCTTCREPFEPPLPGVRNCPSCWQRYLNGERNLKEKCKNEREQRRLI